MTDKRKTVNMKDLRSVICSNRGGLDDATDEQLKMLFDSLSPEDQSAYIKSVGKKRKDKNVSTGATEQDVQRGLGAARKEGV